MSTYKLTYFQPRALAEASRLVLQYAGQPFEDIRLSHDEFPLYKDSELFLFGTIQYKNVIFEKLWHFNKNVF